MPLDVNSKLSFAKDQGDFHKVLKKRVRQYFKTNKISRYADKKTAAKTVLMFLVYFIPLTLLYVGYFQSFTALILLYIVMGLGKAGIGLNVMHDANHGTLFKNKTLNKLCALSMNLLGGSDLAWRYQHNYLHHTYTNIAGSDHDIETTPLLRNSPKQTWKSFHRFQYIYSWILYGLATISRISAREFILLSSAAETGYIKTKSELRKEYAKLLFFKISYVLVMLVFPYVLLDFSIGQILLAFFLMHFITSVILISIFVCAHVMPSSTFEVPDENGKMKDNWAVHQMKTTTNFSQDNKLFTFLIGGLNHQVEHHIFPNVCHAHYPQIAPIVKKTAEEFNVPYHSQQSFFGAIGQHARVLKELSKRPKEETLVA